MDDIYQYGITIAAGALAGAINSVAGGGTLVTFSAMSWLGVPGKIASASSSVGLCPAFLAAAWGFRQHKPPPGKLLLTFSLACLAGGSVGALLLDRISLRAFELIIPWLIMLAALLFLFQEQITRRFLTPPVSLTPPKSDSLSQRLSVKALMTVFVISIYGGFFGAGLGIMLLTVLGLFDLGDIFKLNYLKNSGSVLINLAAAVLYMVWGMVNWSMAGCIALGGCIGAFAMAGLARRLGPKILRRVVSAIGITIALTMLLKQCL